MQSAWSGFLMSNWQPNSQHIHIGPWHIGNWKPVRSLSCAFPTNYRARRGPHHTVRIPQQNLRTAYHMRSSAGTRTAYPMRSSAGTRTTYSMRSSTGTRTAYPMRSSEGTRTTYSMRSSAGTRTAYHMRSSAGTRTAYHMGSSAGTRHASIRAQILMCPGATNMNLFGTEILIGTIL